MLTLKTSNVSVLYIVHFLLSNLKLDEVRQFMYIQEGKVES